VGALAYADDIVLVAPTPSAMRLMLATCDRFAAEYDIIFNALKSNFLVFVSNIHRYMRVSMSKCLFYVGGNPIDYATCYTHLGHTISCDNVCREDIISRRNIFVGQVNNVICSFDRLSWSVKLSLFKTYCTSLFGCELWRLDDYDGIELFAVAWRRSLRRILRLPPSTHNFLLPLLTDTLPLYDEMCKRNARFVIACLFSSSTLVRSIARHSTFGHNNFSVLGRNLLVCCERYSWSYESFVLGNVSLQHCNFVRFCSNSVTSSQLRVALFILELISVRENSFELSNNMLLSREEIDYLIHCNCTL
jgi:hypothetical protein